MLKKAFVGFGLLIDFVLILGVVDGDQMLLSQAEQEFIRFIFPLLLQMMATIVEKKSYGRRSGATALFWAIRETLKTESAEMLVWLLSPRHSVAMRLFTVNTLLNGLRTKDVIAELLKTHVQV